MLRTSLLTFVLPTEGDRHTRLTAQLVVPMAKSRARPVAGLAPALPRGRFLSGAEKNF